MRSSAPASGSQFSIDFAAERARREEGMAAALDHANQKVEEWGDRAMCFLTTYAKANEFLFAETVTTAAKAWRFEAPPTDRAWGGVYQRAVRAGVIERTDKTMRRANGSLAMVYRSLVFRNSETMERVPA